jgi:hypothetical protein
MAWFEEHSGDRLYLIPLKQPVFPDEVRMLDGAHQRGAERSLPIREISEQLKQLSPETRGIERHQDGVGIIH